jgi:hypothetical protein
LKQVLFDAKDFYQTQILAIIEDLEDLLKRKHPSNDPLNKNQGMVKMVFLPNLLPTDKVR